MKGPGVNTREIGKNASRDTRLLLGSLGDEMPAPVPHPVLVVLNGLPGTGKSYFARRLADRVPLAVLGSDALRKVLVRSPSYTPDESTRLFRALHKVIDLLLHRGIPVLVDATNTRETHREQLYEIARRHGARAMAVLVDAPEATVRRRLELRMAESPRRGNSGADWQVYRSLLTAWEPIGRDHLVVDTSRDILSAVDDLAREIDRYVRAGR
jgi:predicted kinase